MRRSIYSHGRGVTVAMAAAVVLSLSLAGSTASQPEALAGEEPPMEFVITVDGGEHGIELGKPINVDVGGRSIQLELSAKPDRLFQNGELSFRYPVSHAFAVDRNTPNATIWTLDGNDNVILLSRFPSDLMTPQQALSVMVNEMDSQFGRGSARQSPTSITLADHELQGTRLDVKIVGQSLRQDLYSFAAGEGTFVLVIQDMPDDNGATTAETRSVTELLERSFTIK